MFCIMLLWLETISHDSLQPGVQLAPSLFIFVVPFVFLRESSLNFSRMQIHCGFILTGWDWASQHSFPLRPSSCCSYFSTPTCFFGLEKRTLQVRKKEWMKTQIYKPVCGAALTRSTSVSILVFAFNFVPENMEPLNVDRVVFEW